MTSMVFQGAQKARELEPLVWDAPLAAISPASLRQAVVCRDARGASPSPKAPLPSIRDRYIAARFPGLARCGADLEKVALVIGGARLYLDERKTDRALELLDLAIQQCPFDEPLRLARLEIAFLLRDAALYTALAEEFQRVHAASNAWPEVARLGRALAPSEAIFGAKEGDRAHEHYGPWPHMPNWIQASWDLTPEVLAADYHRVMARTAPQPGAKTLRVAA
jgi:hypothetical protein